MGQSDSIQLMAILILIQVGLKEMDPSVLYPLRSPLMLALMSPGVLKAGIFVGALYLFYLLDRSVAKRNDGWGILHSWVDRIIPDGADPRLYTAGIEETRQKTKRHYEQSQRPIYRLAYPEYVLGMDVRILISRGANLANPYGLTARDKKAKTERARPEGE